MPRTRARTPLSRRLVKTFQRDRDGRRMEVPADRINLKFLLGNTVMVGTVNANREYFEMG